MTWTIQKVDLEIERQITTAAVVSTEFLRGVQNIYNPSYFQSDYCRLVCHWCLEYFTNYNEAPMQHIQDIYTERRRAGKISPEVSQLIAEFLRGLSKRYEEEGERFNPKYILGKAEHYFRERALELHIENLTKLRDAGELTQAETAGIHYRRPVRFATPGVNPLTDKDLIITALSEEDDDDNTFLYQLPGELGRMLGPFCRDDFIAVAGPMGRGKTWALLYFALQALISNLNVAFFSMGDMTLTQMTARIHRALNSLPRVPGTYLFPVWDCRKNQSGKCRMSERRGKGSILNDQGELVPFQEAPLWTPCTVCKENASHQYQLATWLEPQKMSKALTWQQGLKKGRALERQGSGVLKLEAWPRKTAGITDIEAVLDMWEHDHKFVPDVVVTDYADIMRDASGQSEYRHQLNAIWEAHDSLAKQRHCLVMSATQTTRLTLEGKNVSGSMVAEDIRKLAHVSMMFGLNQTQLEEAMGVMRINVIKTRHEKSRPGQQCYVLQQLDCGQFHLESVIA